MVDAPIGYQIIHRADRNYDIGFSHACRKKLALEGMLPPTQQSLEIQEKRCIKQIRGKKTEIARYIYLSHLRCQNNRLFYSLLLHHMKELTPYVYTPVVGEACQRWSDIYSEPEGFYLSYFHHKGRIAEIIATWQLETVEITVVTDGSRILGLGDLGVNGMGIPVGKLALYTACAGIRPERTLPLTLDFGTDNEELLADDIYLGERKRRVSQEECMEFHDELIEALSKRWPNIIVQYEDFKDPWFYRQYQDKYSCFNDDVQGTGAVILAGVMNAVRRSGIAIEDHRLVFMGAGSAGVGVAEQIQEFFIKSGISVEQAKKMFWLVDSKGLVTLDRGDKLAEHKLAFARDDNNGEHHALLEDVVTAVRPTILMGLCATGGVFTKSIITKMAEYNASPIIFPLSNPSSKSECTFEDALTWTDGRVVFASGSPFDSVKDMQGVMKNAAQGNNMYVFPGIGKGASVCQAKRITSEMIYAAAETLATSLNEEEEKSCNLYPELKRIREVSAHVAVGVIRAAQKEGVDGIEKLRTLNDKELLEYVQASMYDPSTLL